MPLHPFLLRSAAALLALCTGHALANPSRPPALSKLPSLDIVVDRATNSVVLSWDHLLSGAVHLEHSLDTVTWNALSPNNATGNFRHELGNALKGFYRLKPVKSVPPEVAPTAVRDFAATATGVGTLTASWNAPATGNATSYTVTMTTLTGTGSSTQTQVTTNPSVTYTGLSPANSYAFSVTASNAVGTSVAAQASFGQAPITFPQPQALTTGLDGSIWVGSAFGLDPDGEPGLMTQFAKQNGVWTAQTVVPAPTNIYDLAAMPDGSIAIISYGYNGVYWIVNTNGVWDYSPSAYGVPSPVECTVGLDGALWVSCFWNKSIVRFVNSGGNSWYQDQQVYTGKYPFSLTTGLDGSIWVAGDKLLDRIAKVNGVWTEVPQYKYSNTLNGVTTGVDGSIWVANGNMVSQAVNKNGAWQFGQDITVGPKPSALVTGLDGSIWVRDYDNSTVQQIVNKNGAWRALPSFAVGTHPASLTVGLDGSVWVANFASNNVQQIVVPPPSGPSNPAAVFGPAAGQMTLGWQPPLANGGSPAFSYTATVSQGDFFQTIKTTSTSVVFDGLTLGAGPTYFTVSSANFAGVGALVGHQIDAAGNTIPQQPYTAPGISTDGTSFATNGLDDNGYAYSWQAMGNAATGGMRVGSLLAWNGVTFNLAVPNQPNSFWAAGQTINVAQGDYNTLNLAGAGVNGSQQNQDIKLNFTDGSSVVWIQSFSDWGSPQNYGHEAIVSTQSYRNTSTGGTNQFTNHIYGYSYPIPAGKTLASITLPYNTNVRLLDVQMSNTTPVNLSGAYTSWGIANGNTQVANRQGFDGGGYYYYSGNLPSTVSWSGATFNFGPVPNSNNGQNNFVQAKGQTISLPQGDYGWLYLAGAAANGSQQNQQITLTFTDGTTDGWTQSFSDWTGPQNYAKEAIIQKQPNRVNQVGNVHSETNYVYGYAYKIPAGKSLASIKLPNNANVGILGMTMLGNTTQLPYATGLTTDSTPFFGGGFDSDGYAYSWEAMGNAASGGMRVGSLLAWNGVTFDLGSPNQPNFTWAAGQTIGVPQGDYNTLNLAGAAVNGSQQNQQITLTFTDASSVVLSQSFSDWGSGPQNYGEATVSTQSYRNTASGGTDQFTNYIYGYSYAIPAGKTLASITLPNNPNVRLLDLQMSKSTPVNLSGAYNWWGIANGEHQVDNNQGFGSKIGTTSDLGYYYYSGELGSTNTWSGVTFQFGPVPNSRDGQNNFVQARGQTIDLPQGDYGWIYLAGASGTGKSPNEQITLTFTDGSTTTWIQSFSNWTSGVGTAGQTIIASQPNWVNDVGNVRSQTNFVYGYAYQIPADKTLASITLPNNADVGILGMTMLNR